MCLSFSAEVHKIFTILIIMWQKSSFDTSYDIFTITSITWWIMWQTLWHSMWQNQRESDYRHGVSLLHVTRIPADSVPNWLNFEVLTCLSHDQSYDTVTWLENGQGEFWEISKFSFSCLNCHFRIFKNSPYTWFFT